MQQARCRRREGGATPHPLPWTLHSPLHSPPHTPCPALAEGLTSDLHGQHSRAPCPLASAGFGHQGCQQEDGGNEEGRWAFIPAPPCSGLCIR